MMKRARNGPFPPYYKFWPQTMNPRLESTPGWAELLGLAGAVREPEQSPGPHPPSSAGRDSPPPTRCLKYIKIYTYLSEGCSLSKGFYSVCGTLKALVKKLSFGNSLRLCPTRKATGKGRAF